MGAAHGYKISFTRGVKIPCKWHFLAFLTQVQKVSIALEALKILRQFLRFH